VTQDPQALGQNYPCGECGAQTQYDAATQGLKCSYCGHQQAIPAQGGAMAPREIPIAEGMRMAARGLGTPVKEIGCDECGANVAVEPQAQTVSCPFCRSERVLPREAAGNQIRPESVVPFRIDKAAANSAFGEWIGGLWFRPSDLKAMAKVQELGGVYIPFWTFDAQVYSQWSAEAGYYYKETEIDSEGNEREVTRTRWEHAHGHRNDFFDDTVVCASRGLPESLVDRFQSWNTADLQPYEPRYLAGWTAESYAIDLPNAWTKGEQVMATTQQSRCGSDVPGDTHRYLQVQNTFSAVTFKHVLLPVWIAAYRYGDKPYQFLVNGQTGEVVGVAPWSVWKILLFVLTIAAIIAAIVIVTQMK